MRYSLGKHSVRPKLVHMKMGNIFSEISLDYVKESGTTLVKIYREHDEYGNGIQPRIFGNR
jgi:hypothetical protein